MKSVINGSVSHPMKTGYQQLVRDDVAQLSWNTTVYDEVDYIASGTSESENAIRTAGHAVYAHVLQWVVTGNRAHADKAIAIINAWVTGMSSIQGTPGERQNQLEASWDLPIWLSAAEILRHYDSGAAGWAATDIAAFDAWINMWIAETEKLWNLDGNNWYTSGCLAQLCVAVWRDNPTLLTRAVASWKSLVKTYIYDSGQLRETTRDCNHAEYGLIGLIMGAEILWKQGTDVYSYTVGTQTTPRLKLGMEFQANAMLGTPVGGTQDCSGADQHGPGWEMAYNHYKNRAGVATPETEDFILHHNRPVGKSESHFPCWTTATHAEVSVGGPVAVRTATPTITPGSGRYGDSVVVSISCVTSGAVIRYTVDGSTPTVSSPAYMAPFTLSADATVRALATATDRENSLVAGVAYTFYTLPDGVIGVRAVSASSDDGNVPLNTMDNDLATRWSASGDGEYITWDLGSVQEIGAVRLAWYNGDARRAYFDIRLSTDGSSWRTVLTDTGSGTSVEPEEFAVNGSARYVRYVGHGNSSNDWNSITEVLLLENDMTGPVRVPAKEMHGSVPGGTYYDCRGVRLAGAPSRGGVYVRYDGTEMKKVMVTR